MDTFEDFVAARRPELLRTALLLAGDRAGAEDLVQRALTRSRRRTGDRWRLPARPWSPAAPAAACAVSR